MLTIVFVSPKKRFFVRAADTATSVAYTQVLNFNVIFCYRVITITCRVIKKRQGDREETLRHFQQSLKANPENRLAEREYHLMRSLERQAGLFKRLSGKPVL